MNYLKKEYLLVLFLITLFIIIRSIHFVQFLNFSQDQGMVSLSAFEIFKNHQITLIGPPVISIDLHGRYIFYGSIFYYIQLLFLVLGSFDPIKASYFFMLFASLSLIPLYLSVKILTNKKAAILISIIYTLLPYYINYTRFLWNPNYQLVLLTLSFYLLAQYKKNKLSRWAFFNGIYTGLLIPLHYLLIIPALLEIIFYKFNQPSLKTIFLYIAGITIGFLPFIIFEFRNNFYILNTLILYLNNLNQLATQKSSSLNQPHYYLSLSLFFLIYLTSIIKNKINNFVLIFTFVLLLIYSILLYFPTPKNAFRMPENWSYQDEDYLYHLIKNNLPDGSFNITNLGYNTIAWVSKYLLIRDGIKTTGQDYYNNKYLFVINTDSTYMKNYAYEVNKFRPSRQLKSWNINHKYNLYLLERLPISEPSQL